MPGIETIAYTCSLLFVFLLLWFEILTNSSAHALPPCSKYPSPTPSSPSTYLKPICASSNSSFPTTTPGKTFFVFLRLTQGDRFAYWTPTTWWGQPVCDQLRQVRDEVPWGWRNAEGRGGTWMRWSEWHHPLTPCTRVHRWLIVISLVPDYSLADVCNFRVQS